MQSELWALSELSGALWRRSWKRNEPLQLRLYVSLSLFSTSRKAAVDVNTFHMRNWCWKPFTELFFNYCYYYYYYYYYYFAIIAVVVVVVVVVDDDTYWFTCPSTIHFKFLTKCNKYHYKVRQLLFWQSVIFCLSATAFYYKCGRYYKVQQFYYKVRQNMESSEQTDAYISPPICTNWLIFS